MKMCLWYKIGVLVCVGFLWSVTSFAQTRADIDVQHWPKGTVTLTTGEVLEGFVTFYRSRDIITVLLPDSTLSSLSPVNVAHFEVTDGLGTRHHLFRTIYWDQGKDYTDFKIPTFFELVVHGKVTLLMKETYHKRGLDPYLEELSEGTTYDPLGYPISGQFANQIKPRFYVLQPDGEIIKLQQERKDFLHYCGKKASLVKSFARKQKLSFELPHEFVTIVNYYNTL